MDVSRPWRSVASRLALPRAVLTSLALMLALSAVPLDDIARVADDPPGPGAGMSAPPVMLVEGNSHGLAPSDGRSAYRLPFVGPLAATVVPARPRVTARAEAVANIEQPLGRLVALGRLQEDGG